MPILETKHTASRIMKIKKDLLGVSTTISCISMLAFIAYYVYLASLNLHNPIFLIVYSILIGSIILLFAVSTFIKEEKQILKSKQRLIVEKKRTLKTVFKFFKFTAKSALISIAFYETISHFNISLPNIINICSLIFLLLQILFELVIHYVIKQIDYFRLSLDLDIQESSFILKKIYSILFPLKDIEKDIILANKDMLYSTQEQKMIVDIKAEALSYVKEKEKREEELKSLFALKKKKSIVPFLGKLKKK